MALGAELVTNGDFDDDSDWTMDAEWTINIVSNVASCVNGVNDFIEQDIGAVAGKTYQLSYEMTAYTQGGLRPFIGGAEGDGHNVTGSFVEAITAEDTGNLRFRGRRSFTGSIDNVSVKEMIDTTQGFIG